jgi:(p)ppGpp synthase/HD superfamily hydrolase
MEDGESLRRIALALDLAVRAHEGQRRGDGRREPFVSHVADVARRVAESPAVDEPTLLAALLHDVAEKTDHPLSEIAQLFGAEVAGIVAELTDDGSLPGRERKRRQVEAAPGFSDRAKRIKLADKASKLASIAAAPPRLWGRGKARREIEQARKVADGLRGIDPTLEAAFDREANRADQALNT